MNTSGLLRKHWFHVSMHFVTDALLFTLAFVTAMFLRFGGESAGSLWAHWPFFIFGGIVFSATIYIAGLYSTHSAGRGVLERSLVLVVCVLLAVLIVIGGTYLNSARPLGRGIMLLAAITSYLTALLHHIVIVHDLRNSKERVVYVVCSAFDEAETRLFASFGGRNLEFAGVVLYGAYRPKSNLRVLGTVEDLAAIVQKEKISRVLCTHKSMGDTTLTRHFCKLRYSGISVMPLVSLCEEIEQYVPLELISSEWLLNASGEPQHIYIKKLKRLFDIVCSAIGLTLGLPAVALAAVAIRLTSPGPIFYRQTRSGRFGRAFQMTKLRTMHVNAEKDGAVWSGKDDPRVTFVGRTLRRYRIDEIPQLWHVLCGHMSFVGPRPERPEIITQLAREVPYYEERLMVQPGLTGWAQVSYPYGASALDSRRKLEYDLYYMKHMSLFLDVFILLDTVRIILTGGAQPATRAITADETIQEWERLKEQPAPSTKPKLELETA
ncbi:MAG: exopolysaccharide biosynthesis polyprenyl glycosylphosphotransferase [Chthoniobacter sp.]|uniref:exopolysaccharide biosynthesis polyprenyl glycosylphosphotransferase n=1 Tax=Chthoniobacter sp. TaxID=2510640 RepID=UPI0032ABC559